MRRANQKDKSHAGIVDGLRQHGVVVIDMPDPGDVLTYQPDRNVWIPLEFKTAGQAREKPSQEKRRLGFRLKATRADGSRYELDVPPHPIPVVFTVDEALKVLGLT